jgi:hypothetical protein
LKAILAEYRPPAEQRSEQDDLGSQEKWLDEGGR